MFKKYLRNISMFFLCIFATFVYFKNDDVKKEAKATNIQTVIFKDQDETLIPVSVDIGVKDEIENNYRGIIETMKSTDYKEIGLYPLPSLEVITIFFRTTFKPFLSICRFYRLFLYF